MICFKGGNKLFFRLVLKIVLLFAAQFSLPVPQALAADAVVGGSMR